MRILYLFSFGVRHLNNFNLSSLLKKEEISLPYLKNILPKMQTLENQLIRESQILGDSLTRKKDSSIGIVLLLVPWLSHFLIMIINFHLAPLLINNTENY